jgi:hypothetical protein
MVTVSRIDDQGRLPFICGMVALCRRITSNSLMDALSLPIAVRGTLSMPSSCPLMGCVKNYSMWLFRGRESITVVTSDKDLLRESVARSVMRQSASELSCKAQGPSLERQNPSLRERERFELPVGQEQTHRTMPENVQLSGS